MDLVELNEKEYKEFAYNHPLFSFHQSIALGKLKKEYGWDYVLLGIKDHETLKAASLFLIRKFPFNFKMYYAPHGLLIDYSNHELLKEVTNLLKDYIKKHKGFFFKIDPYLIKKQRDKYGNILENGQSNEKDYEYLKRIGYQEISAKKGQNTTQMKWLYWINTENKTLDDVMKDMDNNTRNIVRRASLDGVYIRKADSSEIDIFYDVLKHTSLRNNFVIRTKEYYQKMLELLNEEKLMDIYIAEINLDNKIKDFEKEISNLKKEISSINIETASQKTINKINAKKEYLGGLEKRLKHYIDFRAKDGSILKLSAMFFSESNQEIISFIGGTYDKYLEFQPFYTMNFELLKKTIDHKLKRYNFYGISPDFSKDSPGYGVYAFKKSFGGEVVELFGEFDYPINKTVYYLYKSALNVCHFMAKKRLKIKCFFNKNEDS